MTEGRKKEMWDHTSTVLAMIANVNIDPEKTKPFPPSAFNPYAKEAPKQPSECVENFDALKGAIFG